MKKVIIILVLISSAQQLAAQEETIFLSADVEAVVGYTPWKSFGQFRKTYNSTNQESIENKLGSLSDQYGYNVGIDCFVSNHLYSTFDFGSTYGRTSAKFNNGAQRLIRSHTKTYTTNIGWLQPTSSGYWTLSTGFSVAFGNLRSFIEFADGTRYVHTGGLSGEFRDLNVGVSLKYEYSKKLTEHLFWRSGFETLFFFETSDLGMQNTFVTQTAGSLALNDSQVLFDVSGITFYTGLSYKILQHE